MRIKVFDFNKTAANNKNKKKKLKLNEKKISKEKTKTPFGTSGAGVLWQEWLLEGADRCRAILNFSYIFFIFYRRL